MVVVGVVGVMVSVRAGSITSMAGAGKSVVAVNEAASTGEEQANLEHENDDCKEEEAEKLETKLDRRLSTFTWLVRLARRSPPLRFAGVSWSAMQNLSALEGPGMSWLAIGVS